jgi:class 3 adenylate cyclase
MTWEAMYGRPWMMAMLHNLFAAIDGLCDKHRVEKIETIGDAYLAATGRPEQGPIK